MSIRRRLRAFRASRRYGSRVREAGVLEGEQDRRRPHLPSFAEEAPIPRRAATREKGTREKGTTAIFRKKWRLSPLFAKNGDSRHFLRKMGTAAVLPVQRSFAIAGVI
jgi:hypothetical protein